MPASCRCFSFQPPSTPVSSLSFILGGWLLQCTGASGTGNGQERFPPASSRSAQSGEAGTSASGITTTGIRLLRGGSALRLKANRTKCIHMRRIQYPPLSTRSLFNPEQNIEAWPFRPAPNLLHKAGPEESQWQAYFSDCRAREVVAMHFDTCRLKHEPEQKAYSPSMCRGPMRADILCIACCSEQKNHHARGQSETRRTCPCVKVRPSARKKCGI